MLSTVKNFDDLPACLTVKELQAALGISRPTAYELINTKDFPAVRIGRAVRIPKAALEKWLAEKALEK
ncbi:MAG: helix-turn-helix domain-containing protein [Firmicutes bacterium]|nr:helix-turn-helix domain-containing protein [Bacillota bacterium]